MDWFRGSKKKKSDDYEKEYLAIYKKEQKAKPKKKASKNKKSMEIESDENTIFSEKIKKSRKEEPESLDRKVESVNEEYNLTIKNLIHAKKELKDIKENIQKSNDEYGNLTLKTKTARAGLLKANNELQEKTQENAKSTKDIEKQHVLNQEINHSEKELSEIKEQINRYKIELESVRTKVDNSPDAKKMKEERKKLESEIIQKRKELESGFRELKFIKDEMAKSGKKEGTDKIVDAASAVVASMNQKLQTTITELNAVKNTLESERAQRNKSA